MRGSRWTGIGWVLAAAAIGTGACGLFEPRDPETPPPVVPNLCRALTDSVQIFLSIEEFYGRRTGETCYNQMIDTAFVFVPDPQDAAQDPGQFVNWDETVEIDDNSQIASQQDFISVDFLGAYQSTIISPDQTTETHFQNYAVRFSSTADPDTVDYTGQADLTIHKGADGQWRITSWVDHRDATSGNQTWGILRSNYRVGF